VCLRSLPTQVKGLTEVLWPVLWPRRPLLDSPHPPDCPTTDCTALFHPLRRWGPYGAACKAQVAAALEAHDARCARALDVVCMGSHGLMQPLLAVASACEALGSSTQQPGGKIQVGWGGHES